MAYIILKALKQNKDIKRAFIINKSKKCELYGTSLVVRCLRLCTLNAGEQVCSLVGELRSHMLHSVAKKKKKKFVILMQHLAD